MSDTVPTKIYQILKEVVGGDIDKFILKVNDSNKKGEGYLGQMFFISLLGKDSGTRLNFAIKQAFSEPSIRDFHPIRDVFLNEIYFYRKLWPVLSKFQEKVSLEYRFINLPKCFGATSEENCERLVLENLKYLGFAVHDKKKPLDKKHFESIFKIYGKLHALSFAFKAENPFEFSELCNGILDVWWTLSKKKSFRDTFRFVHETCLEFLRAEVDGEIIEKYRHYVDDGVKLLRKSWVPGRYSVISHGDCWSNNMMFKYNDSGELTDLRFLDFQLVTLGSPVCDLSYCLYSGGTKEVFDDLDYLLQVYHHSLSDCLKAYGCNADDIFPLQELKNSWKFYSQMGFNLGLANWRSKLTYDEEIIDLTDVSVGEGDTSTFNGPNFDKEEYQKIARDIVVHFFENGYMY